MRNQEAARYARWSAVAAGVIALAALGIYAQRAIRRARAQRSEPVAIPSTVQQQSSEFSFSKVDQDRTIFTIRASQATQFKDENRAVLKDVWISIYGTKGERNDSIHTGECSYQPKTGEVRCAGNVEIDIQNANPAPGKAAENTAEKIKVTTRDLYFDRETGEAYTDQPVQYQLPQGSGQAVGVTYSTKDATVRLEHNVQLRMAGSERTGRLPIEVQGSSLVIRRNNLLVTLNGPAMVKQGTRELAAGTISLELDTGYHVKHAIATGNPRIHSAENGTQFAVTADRFEGDLSPAGWLERLAASGNVRGTHTMGSAAAHFSAVQVDFAMSPEKNLIQGMTASGRVSIETKDAAGTRKLETSALRAVFSSDSARGETMHQRIVSAETLAPATIEMVSGTEKTELAANRFRAAFGPDGRFERLLGYTNVRITRQLGAAPAQTSSADEMEAEFAKNGEWNALTQKGNVHFLQGDRSATAREARIVRSTDTIELDGSPVLTDAQSRTSAGKVAINQKTGEVKAAGGVVTTFEPSSEPGGAVSLGTGPAHISAAALNGSTSSGHVMYSGQARLWQGESVLDADQIEVWREEEKLRATGHVAAVFPQASGTNGAGPGAANGGVRMVAQRKSEFSGPPTLWNITAPVLTYWGQEGKAQLDGGVTARSDQGTIHAKTMDVYFAPAGAAGGAASGLGVGSRQFTRAIAIGGVVVTQGDRRGAGQEAEYTATDGKFVLSGGTPTVSDGSGNTTAGHSLTFFVANDTILIDSQTGSRTLTKHRVEK